jgi:hypothetical protein
MPGYLTEIMQVETDAEPEDAERHRIAGDEDEDADNPEGNAAWEHLR